MLYLEDFEIGRRIELGSHKFEQAEIFAFANQFDPQPIHLDATAAETGLYGSLIASGWHTASIFMRCFVDWLERQRREALARGEPLPPVGVSPGVSELRWRNPVRAGDTISYSTTVAARRAIHRPGWGLVTRNNLGFNQAGLEVLSFTSLILTARRS